MDHYQAWLDRELAAGRDPDEQLVAFLDEEPPDLEPADLGSVSDDELVELVLASRRRANREHHEQVLAIAEFGRRRERAYEDAAARGVPTGVRPGGFPGEELAVELTVNRAEAGHLIADAADLTTRLPRTLAGVAAGLIDEVRAGLIAFYTRSLALKDAAYADEILAVAAPELRADQLARKAAALEMKLNPAGVKARREQAERDHQRVEARREASGNASLAAREMDTARALASKAPPTARKPLPQVPPRPLTRQARLRCRLWSTSSSRPAPCSAGRLPRPRPGHSDCSTPVTPVPSSPRPPPAPAPAGASPSSTRTAPQPPTAAPPVPAPTCSTTWDLSPRPSSSPRSSPG